jgi:hypothetical protein
MPIISVSMVIPHALHYCTNRVSGEEYDIIRHDMIEDIQKERNRTDLSDYGRPSAVQILSQLVSYIRRLAVH